MPHDRPEPHELRVLDVPLGVGRRTLRLSVMDDPAGGRVLTFASGHGGGESGDPFLRAQWMDPPLQLPASVLPALRDALAALSDVP